MSSRSRLACLVVLVLSHLSLPASAAALQAGRPPLPDREVGADERRQVLEQVAEQLADGYLYADKGRELAAEVKSAAATDRFASSDRLPAFVGAVNDYLLELSDDRHLRIGHRGGDLQRSPGRARQLVGPDGGAGGEPHSGQGADRRRVVRAVPSHGDGDDVAGHGFVEVRILDGNLGYIDLRAFAGSEAAKPSADAAMTELAGTDALILDLRQNGGGAPYMVRYLSGFFFAEPTHLASTIMRGWDAPRERWTLHDGRPTDAFVDKPVYVLTSRRTFSAAESFTFGLKATDRVTTVGERTGGGGHFGQTVELAGGFRLFLPRGRTYDPRTGQGWEAEGIAPDVAVPASEALEAAIREAKKRLG